MTDQDALAAAAMRLIGAPFRLNGRDPRRGLDCVGVLLAGLSAIGREPVVPLQYRLRRTNIDEFVTAARDIGLMDVCGSPIAGDLLVARPGPAQFHAAVVGFGNGIVHAHAGLGRVVLSPAPMCWPLEKHWRLSDQ
jgi:hypothetical protein